MRLPEDAREMTNVLLGVRTVLKRAQTASSSPLAGRVTAVMVE